MKAASYVRWSMLAVTVWLNMVVFAKSETPPIPKVDGAWWNVTGNPNLGNYTTDRQQPVDFGVWQAADGTWQLWSCIRHTKAGEKTRLFYRWEGQNLSDSDWTPKGIAMEAIPELGETSGGLQAPYVFKENGTYFMFYGGWDCICLATSVDGKQFTRVKNQAGQTTLFSGPYYNSRDAMVLRADGLYYCYYTGHTDPDKSLTVDGRKEYEPFHCAIFCRTSADKRNWSEPFIVSAGGSPASKDRWHGGDSECPFVLKRHGYYYLFRNQQYGPENLNTQYASRDLHNFGVDDDQFMIGTLAVAAPEIVTHDGQDYIVALKESLDGIRMAKLKWSE